MDDKKCAHAACHCVSTPTSEFCGDSCQSPGMDSAQECGCGHDACNATLEEDKARKAQLEAKIVPQDPSQPRGEDPGHTLIDPKPGDEQPPRRGDE